MHPAIAAACLIWSDDLIVHAQRLTRWITDYVDLEESLAVGSIVQEELAHARALLELTGCSIEKRDWRVFVREPLEWLPAALLVSADDDWDAVVARGFLFARGSLTLVEAVRDAVGEPIVPTASVILAEQELHARHWHRWLGILTRDPVTSERMQASLSEAARHCADFFGVADAAGGEIDFSRLHKRWADSVEADLIAYGVIVPRLPVNVTPRSPGGGPYLGTILTEIRAVRSSHPDRVYGIYR